GTLKTRMGFLIRDQHVSWHGAISGAFFLVRRARLGLGSQHRVVGVTEDKYLRSAPNDPFQFHECAHLQTILPQHQVLNEVPREAPGPEWKSPITDRVEAESAHLVDEKIGTHEI